MPKLTKNHAGKAKQAAGDWKDTGFEPLEPGWYLCRLLDVEQKEGKVAPYWSWRYEEVSSKQWLWDNTSLSENAIGRLGKVFEAYGVPADTDTDELIGHLVNIEVTVRPIATGERAGQMSNSVRSLQAGDTHPDYADYAGTEPDGKGKGGLGDEEPF